MYFCKLYGFILGGRDHILSRRMTVMAMEINGNLPDNAVRKQNYNDYGLMSMF